MTAGGAATDEQGARTVAVIDDDAGVRDSLTVLLEAHGFPVRTYAAGDALLADPARSGIGCFVIDQHMPGTDGLGTVARLNQEGVSAPAILVSGRLDPGLRARATELGVLAILEKPFATARLIQLLRDHLQRPG